MRLQITVSKSTVTAAALVALLWLPGFAFAQASPFMTGATALQTNILAWLTPVAIILVMVLGGMAMANRMVVKALSEDGKRLNIRKATLREWRREFARHLREQGVAANATPRAARGATRPNKLDGIYRAAMRGASTHWRSRTRAVSEELARGTFRPEPGKERLLATRRAVVQGWDEIGAQLDAQGRAELAQAARRFAAEMPPPLTEKEQIRATLLEKAAAARVRERPR